MAHNPFRILSLSGGGVRGVFQAVYLSRLAKDLGAPIFKHFDLIAGTSTGSILALAIALDIDPNRIVDLYRHKSNHIFSQRLLKHLNPFIRGPRYDQKELRQCLTEIFGTKQLRDTKTKVLVTASCLEQFSHRVFSTFPIRGADDRELSAVEVALASSAAPSYFSPVKPSAQERSYVDGGLWANSPSLVAALWAHCHLNVPLEEMKLISVGTGDFPSGTIYASFKRMRTISVKTIKTLFDLMFSTQQSAADDLTEDLLGKEHVLRINTQLEQYIPLDDAYMAIQKLPSLAEFQADNNLNQVSAFLKSVTGKHKNSENGLNSGAILCANIDGLGFLNFREQESFIKGLSEEMKNFFLSEEGSSINDHVWINLSGCHLTIFLRPDRQRNQPQHEPLVKCLAFGIWLKVITQNTEPRISIILHWGDDLRKTSLRDRPGLYGNALQVTQQILASANRSSFLVSSEVYEKLELNLFKNRRDTTCKHLLECIRHILYNDPGYSRIASDISKTLDVTGNYYFKRLNITGKDNRNYSYFNLFAVNPDSFTLLGTPSVSPDQAEIENDNTAELSNTRQKLLDLLIKSENITLIDLTHHGLSRLLAEAHSRRDHLWENIRIVFSNEQALRDLTGDSRAPSEYLTHLEFAKRDIQIFFESQAPGDWDHWHCLEYKQNLTFTGGKFTSQEQGIIRLSLIVSGDEIKSLPSIEISEGINSFHKFSEAFDIIIAGCVSIAEWDLVGSLDENKTFRYKGVVNRARILSQQQSHCFPIVLIILYVETMEGLKAIIQKRTAYNATTDLNTYSNISGRLSARDVSGSGTNYFSVEFNKSDFAATQTFNRFSGWSQGDEVPEYVWNKAAIREIKEELGLAVSPSRLKDRIICSLSRPYTTLLFKLFTLKLIRDDEIDEVDIIHENRPHANLQLYTLSELRDLFKQESLNRLLQHKFDEIFVPIYNEIGIVV